MAVAAWGAGTVLAKGIDMGGLAIGAYRFAVFATVVSLWMYRNGTPLNARVVRKSMAGGLALGFDIALFFSALKLTTVVSASLIGALQPIIVAVVAARFFGETIRRRDVVWSAVALAGVCAVVLASNDTSEWSWQGDVLALGATLAWSSYFIASKRASSGEDALTPTEFTAGTAVWTFVITLPLALLFGQDVSWPTLSNWTGLLAMLVISGIGGHVLMNWSLVRIPLWVGSTLTLFTPVAAALLAWVFLDEALSWAQGVPMGLVLLALYQVVRHQAPSPEPVGATPEESAEL